MLFGLPIDENLGRTNKGLVPSRVKRVLGTNPWFKKPRAIGEKVDSFRMVLKVSSGERSKEKF